MVRDKTRYYRQIYLDRPDPIVFIPVTTDTSGHVYDDFNRLLFLHDHCKASALANELPEESDQFRFLRATSLANLKGCPIPLLVPSLVLFPPCSVSVAHIRCLL